MSKKQFISLIKTLLHFKKYSFLKTLHYNFFSRKTFVDKNSFIKISRKCKLHIGKKSKIILTNSELRIEKEVYDVPLPGILSVGNNCIININGLTIVRSSCLNVQSNSTFTCGKININCMSKVNIKGDCVFGENVLIARNCYVTSTNSHHIVKNGIEKQNYSNLNIGDNVWVGSNSVILKNSKIGNNVIIGANTTVNEHIDDNIMVLSDRKLLKIPFDSWHF